MNTPKSSDYYRISVVIATLNSMRTFELCLKALTEQNYPKEKLEILVVDGGSTDGTRELARKYGCTVIDNPKVEPVSAKIIGLKNATGDILMYLDSDEILNHQNALRTRNDIFKSHPEVMISFPSGYDNPKNAPFAAKYINEFGDPFSMFFYRLSKDSRFFINSLRLKYSIIIENDSHIVFNLAQSKEQPLLENAASGNCIRLKFFKEHFPNILEQVDGPVHFFYHMQKQTQCFAISKDDSITHYSADSWGSFLNKIKWRIRNNIFDFGGISQAGFRGRLRFERQMRKLKPYLFVPYVLLILPVLIDSLYLMITRRDLEYWKHFVLCFYTVGFILFYKAIKFMGYQPPQRSYGQDKTIETLGQGSSQSSPRV